MFGLHVRSALLGLNFESKQLYIVYLFGFLASGIWNEVHSTAETVSTIDRIDGLPLTTSQDGAAGRLNPTVSLKTDMISLHQQSTHQTENMTTVIAVTTSHSEEKELHQSTHQTDNFTASSVITSQYEVGKFHQTPLATNITGESHESTHQTDNFTSSSTTTSHTTTDELNPTAELHMLDLTTAFDNLLNTSPTEEIVDSDLSTHKIPCTPEESETVKCLNGGTCVSIQTSNTSRVRLCSCPFDYTGKRCEIRFVAGFWKSKANVIEISAGTVGAVILVVVLVVALCCWWRKRRRSARNSMTEDVIWSDKQKKRKREGFKPTEVLHLNSSTPIAANVNTTGEACASTTFLGGVNDRDREDQDSRAV